LYIAKLYHSAFLPHYFSSNSHVYITRTAEQLSLTCGLELVIFIEPMRRFHISKLWLQLGPVKTKLK